MSEDVAVYRRRKASRCENDETRQRVIGGIGRRRNTTNNAIQSRIQQFAQQKNDEDKNDGGDVTAMDDGVLSPPRVRRNHRAVSRSNSASSTELLSWKGSIGSDRRSNSVSSNSSSAESTTSTVATSNSVTNNDQQQQGRDVSSPPATPPKYGAMNTPGRSRRVSVATTNGKDHQIVGLQKTRSDSTLGQGSLLKSKQMKWENLSNENDAATATESIHTSKYRRKFSDSETVKVNPSLRTQKNVEPIGTNVSKVVPVTDKSKDSSSPTDIESRKKNFGVGSLGNTTNTTVKPPSSKSSSAKTRTTSDPTAIINNFASTHNSAASTAITADAKTTITSSPKHSSNFSSVKTRASSEPTTNKEAFAGVSVANTNTKTSDNKNAKITTATTKISLNTKTGSVAEKLNELNKTNANAKISTTTANKVSSISKTGNNTSKPDTIATKTSSAVTIHATANKTTTKTSSPVKSAISAISSSPPNTTAKTTNTAIKAPSTTVKAETTSKLNSTTNATANLISTSSYSKTGSTATSDVKVTRNDTITDATVAKEPPAVRPKRKVAARKLSSSIAAIQNQLETNFDSSVAPKSPVMLRASKDSAASRVITSPLVSRYNQTPTSSTHSVSSGVHKIKNLLYDVNNNDASPDGDDKRMKQRQSTGDSLSSDKSVNDVANNAKNQLKSQIPVKLTSSSSSNIANVVYDNKQTRESSSELSDNLPSTANRDVSVSSFDGNKCDEIESENETNNALVFANKTHLTERKTKITLTKTDNDKLLHTQDYNKNICNESHSPGSSSQNNLLLEKTLGDSGYKTSNQAFEENISIDKDDANSVENCNSLSKASQKSAEIISDQSHNKKVLDSKEEKKSFDDDHHFSGCDNNKRTGVHRIENSFHAEGDLTDQKELSKQKTQVDIFSTSSDSSLHREKAAFVNENTDFLFETKLNADDIKYVNEINSDAIIEKNNYAKYEKITQRLSERRGRSSTWTTSDSEEILESELSPEEKDSNSASSSLSGNITEEKDTPGRRRRLTKKRSKRSKIRPKVQLRNCSQSRSFDTSDGDILDNYTSDDFSTSKSRELSSAAESTICESDINDNYKNLDVVAITNKDINFSTFDDNTESTFVKNTNNNKTDILSESEVLLSEIQEYNTCNSDLIKSESMTAITKHQQQNLISLSSSNMGGSRSEDEGVKLATLHKTKDERIGSLSSITTVSTKVIQSFNTSSFSSPPFKKRANSEENQPYHSISLSEIPNSHNNNNSIKANPFSLSGLDKHSDTEYERTTRSEKLESLKQDFPLNSTFMKKPYSQPPDDESKKTAEVLERLPHYPFYLSERFTRDVGIMQSRSTGSLGKMLSDTPQLVRDINIDGDSIPTISPFTHKKLETNSNSIDNEVEYIAPPDNFKDEVNTTSKHFKARPPINMSPKPLQLNNEKNTPTEEVTYLENTLRRSSYLMARDENEEGADHVFIPKVPPPPNSENDNNDVRVIKRPGLPKLPTTIKIKNDSPKEDSDETERVVTPPSPIEKQRQDNDSEDDVDPNFKDKVEQVENKRSRSRLVLAQPPQLSGIPEVPPNLFSGKRDNSFKRKDAKYHFPEDTILEEVASDNAKVDHDVDNISQGSDLRSTPRDLSMEDLSSDTDNNKDEEVLSPSPSSKKLFSPSSASLNESMRSVTSLTSMSATTPDDVSTEGLTIPRINTPDVDVESRPRHGKVKKPPKPEMRRHVMQNLLDTEKSYVTNLGAMLTMFYHPLKHPENNHIVEPGLLDEIFSQIPEILESHEHFLDEVSTRVDEWSDEQIIGDIFSISFTKHKLMDAYSNFINNFVQASDAIRQASSRPQFTKYLEQCMKEHKEKLTLSEMFIKPVQRIPRYVLILTDMLKHTPDQHPDYTYLIDALREIKKLAEKMDKGEAEAKQSEKDVDKLRDIEQTIEGIADLVSGTRKFIRQDLVAENKGTLTKKDRCLFLFSNLLVCTTVRRKNHVLRRNSLFTGQSAAEFNRYKFLWKLPLEDVEVSKAPNSQQNNGGKEVEKLEDDVKTLENMLNLSDAISVPHQNVEASLRELIMDVKSMVQEKQSQSPLTTLSPMLTKIELQAQTDEGIENYTFIFLSAECKSSWEAYFNDAKQKLAYSRDTFPPEFQYATPINKTRSGMQFTCAAPSYISSFNERTISNGNTISGDVWVCNSDGYVGQVCLLSMTPDVQSKASLSVCSARIVCIAVVPGARLTSDKSGGSSDIMKMASMTSTSKKGGKSSSFKHHKKSIPSDMSDDDDTYGTGAENIMAFDSSGDDDDPMPNHYMGNGVNPFSSGRISPDSSSLGATESMDGDRGSSDDDYSSDDDERDGSSRLAGNDEFDNDLDARACMWLGTEDGHIYIYNAQDAITQRKSKARLQMSSPVTSLLYFENKVFVALGGGELCIYKRDMSTGEWDLSSPENIRVSITGAKISCMTAVAGRIWCGCDNTIVLVNATSLRLEPTIVVSDDSNRIVNKIVSYGLGVWVSLQGSATVRLYHATTYENLLDVDVTQAVQKMLAGADAIIRQHKAACLRVTSLLICKDLLWIGTSAGVLLTNPLPSITASTSVLKNIGPTGSPHGHTGHVRFLTSIEVPKGMFRFMDDERRDSGHATSPSPSNNRIRRKDFEKLRDLEPSDVAAGGTDTLVVSGGDGYEDFRNNQQNEAVGRDDSTNHLLLWRV